MDRDSGGQRVERLRQLGTDYIYRGVSLVESGPDMQMTHVTGVAQIALSVRDLPRAIAFYRDVLGLRHLFDAPNMSFFDSGGVRLMLSAQGGEPGNRGTLIYLRVADATAAHAELSAKNVHFEQPPHVIGRSPTAEVWLAWCADPDGNLLGLMSEKPLT
jgi:methylmalonyl-CoA/ethylmalonyl-CoA epimerase